jgi:hypothetical protein
MNIVYKVLDESFLELWRTKIKISYLWYLMSNWKYKFWDQQLHKTKQWILFTRFSMNLVIKVLDESFLELERTKNKTL